MERDQNCDVGHTDSALALLSHAEEHRERLVDGQPSALHEELKALLAILLQLLLGPGSDSLQLRNLLQHMQELAEIRGANAYGYR